jgi:hypothetical protein
MPGDTGRRVLAARLVWKLALEAKDSDPGEIAAAWKPVGLR